MRTLGNRERTGQSGSAEVEQLGSEGQSEAVERFAELLFELLQVHGIGTLAPDGDSPDSAPKGFSRLGAGTWWP
jgi:hypothetical protein